MTLRAWRWKRAPGSQSAAIVGPAGSFGAEIEAELADADLVVVLVGHECLPRQLVALGFRAILDTRRWLPTRRWLATQRSPAGPVDPTDSAAANDGAVVEVL